MRTWLNAYPEAEVVGVHWLCHYCCCRLVATDLHTVGTLSAGTSKSVGTASGRWPRLTSAFVLLGARLAFSMALSLPCTYMLVW